MLTGIRLRNFKAFGDEMQEAPLSKITLIYGPNSGGKSSIIQSLLLLKQSASEETLMPRGEFVDLGSFPVLLHNHDPERSLGIGITFKGHSDRDSTLNAVNLTFRTGDSELSRAKDSIGLLESKCQISYREDELLDLTFQSSQLKVGHDVKLTEFSIAGQSILNERETIQLKEPFLTTFLPFRFIHLIDDTMRSYFRTGQYSEDAEIPELLQLSSQILQVVSREFMGTASEEREQLLNLMKDSQVKSRLTKEKSETLQALDIPRRLEMCLRKVVYLGPLRNPPQRLYPVSGGNKDTIGIRGEFLAHKLYYDDSETKQEVNRWFEKFKIPYDLDTIPFSDKDEDIIGDYVAVALTQVDPKERENKGVTVTIADVGFGINQVLPVIVEGVASEGGSIICVEQPEIHLHPRLQANIADLMIDTIADEPGKQKQWIVETHSELLILRLQRRIREGKIKPEDISVLYVDPNDGETEGSAILQLRIDEEGDFIDEWPHGFFDEGFNELIAEPEPEEISIIRVEPGANGSTIESIQSDELMDV